MNCVADENVDQQIVHALRGAGHQVWAVAEQASGISDDDVLFQARDDGAVLITADKDFGELVFRRGQASAGVLLLRLAGVAPAEKARLVVGTIEHHGEEMRGGFSVLGHAALRIRRSP